MPSLGADMREGRIVEWLVEPGQEVHKGDIVAVVDTDKAEIEIETFHDGVVGELLVGIGEKVPVGTAIARINAAAGTANQSNVPDSRGYDGIRDVRAVEPAAAASVPAAPEQVAEHHARVSPLARRLAADAGIDPETLQGTGPHGSVVRSDVEAAIGGAPAAPPAPEPPAPEPPAPQPPAPAPSTPESSAQSREDAMRQAIGALMARSKREIPHYYLGTHVDMTAALTLLAELNAELPIKERILPAALLLRATALAAAEHRALNGFWEDGAFVPASGVHLGVAISLRGGGLVAPALHDVDRLDLHGVMAGLRELVARARAGRLRGSEMRDPTLTVTNLGEQGVETVHGVIYPPQVALVGFGRVVERPWARDGMVGAHPVLHATLAADHRASDGHTGGLFLAAIQRHIEEPAAP
jgi:pyruvate dehydrogenase E2 component (dihydrolipoamide acetyltransferase)